MAFHILISSTGAAPIISCDHCGSRVEDAGLATCYWKEAAPNERSEVFIVHKKCHRAFDEANGAGTWPTLELQHFLVDVSYNVGMSEDDWNRARESSARLRSI